MENYLREALGASRSKAGKGCRVSNEPMTLREIAEHEGVSHQAVAEILERALRKVRIAFMKRGIKLDDLV